MLTIVNVKDLLRSLGIGRQYLGYSVTLKAVVSVLQDENRLYCLKQSIFLPMAEECQCDWRSIERNIRTVIHRAWQVNQPHLTEIAGYPLTEEPTVTEFIEILSSYLLRNHSQGPHFQ